MLIVVINAPFHLFQKLIGQFTVVIALDKTNQMILVEIDHLETIEVQDIPETIEVQDIPETIEVHEISETILDQTGGVRKF
ncbi:hypothetical protein [Candidatus Nitrosomarinus catalina]|uniref:hypothetical protein n=1 Tax=Candidatus Nitrosomarinus catalinensis TaxID=1898749 RepID=UPI001CEF8E47|nr:hypothetical protein [Candidatus Nitrosomarinus catalina]